MRDLQPDLAADGAEQRAGGYLADGRVAAQDVPDLRAENAADVGDGDRLTVDNKLVDLAVVVDFKGELGVAVGILRGGVFGPRFGVGRVKLDDKFPAIGGCDDLTEHIAVKVCDLCLRPRWTVRSNVSGKGE
jgi:hypothetical protein